MAIATGQLPNSHKPGNGLMMMTKTLLAVLALTIGLATTASGAAAGIHDTGIYKNLTDWQLKAFTSSYED